MRSIVGVWQLLKEEAWDEGGQPAPTLFGPVPMGAVSLLANGRMTVVMSDGRPDLLDGQRSYASYCGSYTFDGSRLVTTVDDGSSAFWRQSPQIRVVRFQGDHMVLSPAKRVSRRQFRRPRIDVGADRQRLRRDCPPLTWRSPAASFPARLDAAGSPRPKGFGECVDNRSNRSTLSGEDFGNAGAEAGFAGVENRIYA